MADIWTQWSWGQSRCPPEARSVNSWSTPAVRKAVSGIRVSCSSPCDTRTEPKTMQLPIAEIHCHNTLAVRGDSRIAVDHASVMHLSFAPRKPKKICDLQRYMGSCLFAQFIADCSDPRTQSSAENLRSDSSRLVIKGDTPPWRLCRISTTSSILKRVNPPSIRCAGKVGPSSGPAVRVATSALGHLPRPAGPATLPLERKRLHAHLQ
jgi:hypothetical protein